MSKREGGLGQYLGVLQVGQLRRMIVYLLAPLTVFCRSGRTVSISGSMLDLLVLYVHLQLNQYMHTYSPGSD